MSHTLHTSTDELSATGIFNNYAQQADQQYSPDEDAVDQVAEPILSNFENLEDYQPIDEGRVTVLQDGDLLELAQNLMQMLKTASPQIQLIVKQQLKKELASLNPEIPLDSSQYKVKPKITENDLANLYKEIDKLLEETKKLRVKAETRIKLIAGAATTLNKNDPEYATEKEKALKYFNDYEGLYNQSVDILARMSKEDDAIENLKQMANETIDQFVKENNLRLVHFQKQFNTLQSEHGFVDDDVKYGSEGKMRRILGSEFNVSLPVQKELTKDLTQSQLDLSADFTSLFIEINENYYHTKAFGDKVQQHLNKVAGTRKSWDQNHPDYQDFKDSASYLPKKYEPLAKECSDVYEKLALHNDKLEGLKSTLGTILAEKSKDIQKARALHLETFTKYVNESKKLDTVIHGSLTICKDIRSLSATTRDKYPTKEKEEVKEM